MRLRPHHLLCIQKFTGHGYDEAFTQHMTALVEGLRAAPDTIVEITEGCDDLCVRCPHRFGNACDTREKVQRMDERMLALCGFGYGQMISWQEAAGKARKTIFDTDSFETVCGGCQWYALCKATEVPYD